MTSAEYMWPTTPLSIFFTYVNDVGPSHFYVVIIGTIVSSDSRPPSSMRNISILPEAFLSPHSSNLDIYLMFSKQIPFAYMALVLATFNWSKNGYLTQAGLMSLSSWIWKQKNYLASLFSSTKATRHKSVRSW